MEDQGYLDIQNERKANEIRKLMTEAANYRRNENPEIYSNLSKKAAKLSNELKDYLLSTYPDKFNIINIRSKDDDEHNYLINPLNWEDIIKKYNIQVNDVVIIREDIFKIVIFVDENGPHFEGEFYSAEEGPKEWYEFLERMGLLSQIAADLYNRKDNSRLFYTKSMNYWPNIKVNHKNKL